jgi:O-antigen/teichoic acid export membrane protein
MSLLSRFAAGTSLGFLDQGLKIISALVLTPLIVASVGDRAYGAWCVLMAVFAQYGWLDLGLGVTIPRFFAKAIGAKDAKEMTILANTGAAIFAVIAGLSVLASTVVWWLSPGWFSDSSLNGVIRTVVALLSIYFASQTSAQLHLAFLKGHMRYDRIALLSMLRTILTAGGLVFVLGKGWGLLGLATVHALCGVAESIGLIGVAHVHKPGLRVQPSLASRPKAMELFKYASVSYLMMAGQSLRNTFDPIIIAMRVGEDAVTGYALGNRFPVMFVDIAHILAGGQLLSVFSRYVGDNDMAGLKRAFYASAKVCAVIGAFGAAMLWLLGAPFLQRWIPAQAAAAWAVMLPAILPKALFIAQTPSMVLLMAMASHRRLAVIDWIAGVLNLCATWWLAGWLGAPGAAYATCVEQSIVCGMIWPLLAARALGVSYLNLLYELLLSPAMRVGLMLLPCALLSPWLQPDYAWLICVGAGCSLWFVLLSLVFLRPEERSWMERLFPFTRRSHVGPS